MSKKEYFVIDDVEYNTHQALATNIKEYIEDKDNKICMSVYSDLRFVKQFYALDGRNMCPIIPLKEEEFNLFYNYKDKKYNPYMDYDFWNDVGNFRERGLAWWGFDNMNKLDSFLDDYIEVKLNEKKQKC